MDTIYVHANFDGLDLDARSQSVWKGKQISALNTLGNYKQARTIYTSYNSRPIVFYMTLIDLGKRLYGLTISLKIIFVSEPRT